MSSSFLPSSVSSSSFGPIGPLTTIFTPPADCFTATPSVWETCGVSYGTARCYWSQPDSCYPSGAQITSSIIWGLGTTLYPAVYAYSPGVLPSGYVTSGGLVDNTLIDSVSGCYAGWTSVYYCTSMATGVWVSDSSTHSGGFAAILPQVVVSWSSTDFLSFTPTSAPVLPAESIAQYESSVDARSRSTGTPAQTPAQTAPTPNVSTQPTTSDGGLSTGAKAGIGVGVGIGVLLLLGVVFLVWRKRYQRRDPQRSGVKGSEREKTESIAELPGSNTHPKELRAERDPQEVATTGKAPPVPIASKPRYQAELA